MLIIKKVVPLHPMKTVSVVMCTYNGAKFIREQLDSIISQTYPIYELIIQDDCSTDETVAIIKEYMEKYSFIKLYVNEQNLGFNQNFKSVVMKATGDYVAISDQDDVWFSEKIEKQVSAIGNADICCYSRLKGDTLENAEFIRIRCNFERLLFYNTISGHTMLCQRSFIQDRPAKIGTIWYDWDFALYASLHHGIATHDAPQSWHRQHPNQASAHIHERLPPYYSYLWGIKRYLLLKRNKNWNRIYTFLYHHTSDNHFQLEHRFCELLLKDDFISLLRLCRLCQKHRNTIYYDLLKTEGLLGWVRGFFFPFIHACTRSDMYKEFSCQDTPQQELG